MTIKHFSPSEIAERRAMLAAATPGPWEHPYGSLVKGDDQFVARCEMIRRPDFRVGDREAADNAALITTAVNDYARLLDAAEREDALRVEVERLRAALVAIASRCAGIARRRIATEASAPAGVVKIERAVADDLVREIYRREGWTRHDRTGFSSCAMREALADLVAVIDTNGIFDGDYPRVMDAARAALATDRENVANAHIMAAAPDLLAAHLAWEAAEDARNDCNDPDDGCDNEGPWEACPHCSVRFGEAIDLRHAAIARAEGRAALATDHAEGER